MKVNRLQWFLTSGIAGFLIVLLSSFAVNEAATSFFRAGIAFFLAAPVGLLFSYVWDWITMDLTTTVRAKKSAETRNDQEDHDKS
ncbi:hypothetical protein [Salisediminibacterium halotolerans]|uniref:hypothetical protein n=1 Tax=Salisediminibacterium halotolerans TaxID=517425 RepID=UPI000EAC9758|nr:hypothetical protein [Salisediminibacterium halotolerans]RLJ74195.1 hypothetical protein BCL39_1483 [Actinophytocola xinjiangensis]RPE87712.1 hypothetical protein EDD67_1448 [Salisediminibacterium halotolerans]TWG35032.1 hypothetical protein BCL52_1480 [Salisediminibacterium halotolerans]GEL06681.1 hypothetical protein SHA02_00970 [Salisediminibacterium halotolerans]